jgi:pimeloyl-ACP methyl ester carboxylesterase
LNARPIGNVNPLLLISGSRLIMDAWEPSFLKDVSSNHTVTIFDNHGLVNITSGANRISNQEFADDTVAFLDALKGKKRMLWDLQWNPL